MAAGRLLAWQRIELASALPGNTRELERKAWFDGFGSNGGHSRPAASIWSGSSCRASRLNTEREREREESQRRFFPFAGRENEASLR